MELFHRLDLMGRVIEIVSGMAFDEYLAQRIFAPTGMTSTWFQVPANEAKRLTTNYAAVAGTLVPIDVGAESIYLDKPAFPFGGSGLVSSPRDYDHFLEMLGGFGQIGGTRVMNEQAVRIGTGNLLPAGTAAAVDMARGIRSAIFVQVMPPDALSLWPEYRQALAADIAALGERSL